MTSDDEWLDNGSASPAIPAAELPAFYRAIADRLRSDAMDSSRPSGMRDQILKEARRFDKLSEVTHREAS